MNWQHHGTAPRATQTTTDRIPDRRPVSHRAGSRPGMTAVRHWLGTGQVRAAVTR